MPSGPPLHLPLLLEVASYLPRLTAASRETACEREDARGPGQCSRTIPAALNRLGVKDYQTAICVAHRLPSASRDILAFPQPADVYGTLRSQGGDDRPRHRKRPDQARR